MLWYSIIDIKPLFHLVLRYRLTTFQFALCYFDVAERFFGRSRWFAACLVKGSSLASSFAVRNGASARSNTFRMSCSDTDLVYLPRSSRSASPIADRTNYENVPYSIGQPGTSTIRSSGAPPSILHLHIPFSNISRIIAISHNRTLPIEDRNLFIVSQ
jgi:hypothetical protein